MSDRRTVRSVVGHRGWRTYAHVRRRLARTDDARRVAAVARRRGTSLETWNRTTAVRHARYRQENPPADGRSAILCVSNRPQLLASVVASVARQLETTPEFVLVPNGDGWDRRATDVAMAALDDAVVVWAAGDATLGEALNVGLAATDARFVAKFDDDDHYGPHYLADALRAHSFAGAGVVGKHTYYADVDGIDERLLRFPGHEFSYGSTLAGGTLVIDRERVGDLRFQHVSLGEDRAFIQACHRRGVSTYSSDRFNFVQHRGADNTWTLGAEDYLAGCVAVDGSAAEHEVDR